MIPRKLATTQRNKVQAWIKPESNKKKLRGRKRRHHKRKINIGQNNKIGRTRFRCFNLVTTSFEDKRTTYFSK